MEWDGQNSIDGIEWDKKFNSISNQWMQWYQYGNNCINYMEWATI